MNNYPDIDLASLKLAIEEKATHLLVEVSEDSLKTFSQEVKLIATGKLEEYIFKVYDLYSDGARKISDYETLSSFTDFSSGYQSLMLKWIEESPIEIREQRVSIPPRPVNPQVNSTKPIVSLGIGTAIAIGLYIFSNVWVALAAELLTVAITYKQHQSIRNVLDKYEYDNKAYEFQLRKLKQQLVDGLSNDLVKWVLLGKTYSDSILKSYNL